LGIPALNIVQTAVKYALEPIHNARRSVLGLRDARTTPIK